MPPPPAIGGSAAAADAAAGVEIAVGGSRDKPESLNPEALTLKP
jgi:hypothetical protein